MVFEGNETLKLPLLSFFEKAVPRSRWLLKLRPGKGRDDAINDFRSIACRPNEPFTLLLIDSEGPYDDELVKRLNLPKSISDDQVAWMVQAMESWFLADSKALIKYYGDPNIPNKLPKHSDVELAPKDHVLKGLKRAAKQCGRDYQKGADAARLLELLDPAEVRQRARHCNRLLTIIEERVKNTRVD